MLLQTLAASILGIALAGRGVIRAGEFLKKKISSKQTYLLT